MEEQKTNEGTAVKPSRFKNIAKNIFLGLGIMVVWILLRIIYVNFSSGLSPSDSAAIGVKLAKEGQGVDSCYSLHGGFGDFGPHDVVGACVTAYAVAKKDTKVCFLDPRVAESGPDGCLIAIAQALEDPKICAQTKNSSDLCLLYIAQDTKNQELCQSIQAANLKQICQARV